MRRRQAAPDQKRYPLAFYLYATCERLGLSASAVGVQIERTPRHVIDMQTGRRSVGEGSLKGFAKLFGVPESKLKKLANQQEAARVREYLAQLEKAS